MIQVGQKIPDFEVPALDGENVEAVVRPSIRWRKRS